jgi:hypothetical protein
MSVNLRSLLWVFLAVSLGYLIWTVKDIVTNASPGLSWSNFGGAIGSSSLAALLLLSGHGRTNPKPRINPNQLGEKAEN